MERTCFICGKTCAFEKNTSKEGFVFDFTRCDCKYYKIVCNGDEDLARICKEIKLQNPKNLITHAFKQNKTVVWHNQNIKMDEKNWPKEEYILFPV